MSNSISYSPNLKSNLKSTTNKYIPNNNKSISFTLTKHKQACHDKKYNDNSHFESKGNCISKISLSSVAESHIMKGQHSEEDFRVA